MPLRAARWLTARVIGGLIALSGACALGAQVCGEVVTVSTHGATTTRYALARPSAARDNAPVSVLLLVGGGGHLDLDEQGCPRALRGNFLGRSLREFHAHGFVTALVDAPSDHPGDDGLGGFRSTAQHAEDLGRIVTDLRKRVGGAVWIIGTSRGTISAANAASRLGGAQAPDGVVLTSAITSGTESRKRPWVNQTVFDLRLETIRLPALVVGHEADRCPRTPAVGSAQIISRLNSSRSQAVTVTGGPGVPAPGVNDCEGRAPHGFLNQEAEVISGIARFMRGERY